jgi:hypothetical protein
MLFPEDFFRELGLQSGYFMIDSDTCKMQVCQVHVVQNVHEFLVMEGLQLLTTAITC